MAYAVWFLSNGRPCLRMCASFWDAIAVAQGYGHQVLRINQAFSK
jgi:hypothetical protein